MKNSYVYVIFRPDGEPCYVGKGRGGRWLRHVTRSHNPHLQNIYAMADGHLPIVKVREDITDVEAIETEIALIAAIGRECHGGPLVNQTDGGDGTAGAKMTEEWRLNRKKKALEAWADPSYRSMLCAKKIGNQNSKKPHVLSEWWREKLTQKMIGNKFTLGRVTPDHERKARSLANKGIPKSPEHKAAISRGNTGKVKSLETRAKIGAAHRGKIIPQEVRKKISESSKGKPKSAETRAKMKVARARQIRGPLSAETKAKISISSSRPRKPLTQEHKDKIAETKRRNR